MSSWLAKAAVTMLGLLLVAATGAAAEQKKPKPLPLKQRCVTAAERKSTARFLASDGTRLVGVQFGRGPKGVVLAHQGDRDLCSWVPYARRLALLGYRALVFDHRGFGSAGSSRVRANTGRVDLDIVGAARELRRRGAASVVLAGTSLGGSAVLAGGAQIRPAVQGVVSLSGAKEYRGANAIRAMPRLTAPALFVSAEQDGHFADEARALHAAAAAPDKRLVIVPGFEHGIDLLREPALWTLFTDWIAAHSSAPGS